MAKQESFIKLRGKMGDLSFYKHREHGYAARMKGGVDANRIATDPAFQRTRENNAEFGRAVSTAKKIKQQINNLLFYYGDSRFSNRLTALVHRIQKHDSVNPRGEREFLQANSLMLKGMEMNAAAKITGIFAEELTTVYDRITGEASLTIPTFNPQNSVTLLSGATHIQFTLAAAELDLVADFGPRPQVLTSSYIPVIGSYPGDLLHISAIKAKVYLIREYLI